LLIDVGRAQPTVGGAILRQADLGCIRKVAERGWRDGSAVKSTDCSSRGPEFNSQQPHGSSKTIPNGIQCPLLGCLKIATVCPYKQNVYKKYSS